MSRLAPPPKTPNCVHSNVASKRHAYIEPLPIPAGGFEAAKKIALGMPRSELSETAEGYAHLVFTTAVFRFKDDLELELAEDVIHVRSASRVGKSDLGKNRKRVEALRSLLRAAT
ncbi:MAG: DUF1499 domain-containing protein [Proteobacteria bacterium]|nr:DUF1499 domain-containing protein [Pseudomonadota bacterium]